MLSRIVEFFSSKLKQPVTYDSELLNDFYFDINEFKLKSFIIDNRTKLIKQISQNTGIQIPKCVTIHNYNIEQKTYENRHRYLFSKLIVLIDESSDFFTINNCICFMFGIIQKICCYKNALLWIETMDEKNQQYCSFYFIHQTVQLEFETDIHEFDSKEIMMSFEELNMKLANSLEIHN
jgi:hypothetical protein